MQRKSIISLFVALLIPLHAAIAQKAPLKEMNMKDYGSQVYSWMDPVLSEYQVFTTGEDFKYEVKDMEVQLNLLKYLGEHAGVNTVMMEFGLAEADYINQYLADGSRKDLGLMKDHLTETELMFFAQVQQLNLKMEDREQIELFAVGHIDNSELALIKMEEWLRGIKVKSEFKAQVQSLRAAAYLVYKKHHMYDRLKEIAPFYSFPDVTLNFDEALLQFVTHAKANSSYYKSVVTSIRKEFNYFINYQFESLTLRGVGASADPFSISDTKKRLFVESMMTEELENNPRKTYYALLGWANQEELRREIRKDLMAFDVLTGAVKEEYKVFSILMLSNVSDEETEMHKIFENTIRKSLRRGYTYSTFKVDSTMTMNKRLNNVILMKAAKMSLRSEEEIYQVVESYKSFYLNYGLFGYVNNDIGDLNKSLKNTYPGFSDFKTELGVKFVDLTADLSGMVFKISHKWTEEEVSVPSQTEALKFSQFSTIGYGGYNLFRSQKKLMGLMLGFGYAKSQLEFTEEVSTPVPPFTQTKSILYENPSFVMDYMIDFNIPVYSYIGVGFNMGYVLDLSNPQWRTESSLVNSSPEFKNSGFHASFSVMVNLNMN
jgi:hypothetical protein